MRESLEIFLGRRPSFEGIATQETKRVILIMCEKIILTVDDI